MPGRGFSLTMVPHDGRTARHFEVGGRGLFLLWAAGVVLVALVASAAVVLLSSPVLRPGSSAQEMRIAELEDSLQIVLDFQARLDSIEAGLQDLREARERLEGIVEYAGPEPADTP